SAQRRYLREEREDPGRAGGREGTEGRDGGGGNREGRSLLHTSPPQAPFHGSASVGLSQPQALVDPKLTHKALLNESLPVTTSSTMLPVSANSGVTKLYGSSGGSSDSGGGAAASAAASAPGGNWRSCNSMDMKDRRAEIACRCAQCGDAERGTRAGGRAVGLDTQGAIPTEGNGNQGTGFQFAPLARPPAPPPTA
ncbi:hypothetical protein Vretifemale_11647, partial [Volvox reticuliferus]